MNDRTFNRPIETIVGLGFIKPIKTIEEAYSFLMEWRRLGRPDDRHRIAVNAVKAALAREVEAETVRPLIVAFARKAGILAPTMDNFIAGAAMAGKFGQSAH